jgi:CPA1 family monovalent cation:H+ antiporter
MTLFDLIALILTFAALGGYLNAKLTRLPTTIGYMAFALLLSLLAIAGSKLGFVDLHAIADILYKVDFSKLLLHGMLAFLLFAGALHIDLGGLKKVALPVAVLATLGVLISTVIVGTLTWYGARLLGVNLDYLDAMLFGALISPTDPIAVLSILKAAGAPERLYLKIGGESLFNDGVGVVLFLAVLKASQTDHFDLASSSLLFFREAVGGLALGIALGWLSYRLLRSIDDYHIEAMITLALASGGYALAEGLGVSAPICIVAAGLIMGNQGRRIAMSALTRRYLDVFWEILDEILNAVLFLLIGFGLIIIPLTWHEALLALMATAAVLAGRFVSIGIPITVMRLRKTFERGTIRLMTWGGLRGGISIAMALSLPYGEERQIILPMTYFVVLFSIFVQGLTFGPVVRMVLKSTTLPATGNQE